MEFCDNGNHSKFNTVLKPALPGEIQGSALQQKVFNSAGQSPVQEEVKVAMFGQGVRMPMTVLGQHPGGMKVGPGSQEEGLNRSTWAYHG